MNAIDAAAIRATRWLLRPVDFVPYVAICWVSGMACLATWWTGVGLSPGRTTSETSWALYYATFACFAVFIATAGTLLGYKKEFRLLYADRKNPFRAQIVELVQLNRDLLCLQSDVADNESRKLTEKIERLRAWPEQYSKQELQSFSSSYLVQTAQDRKLALEEAERKLSEYSQIAEERRRAIES